MPRNLKQSWLTPKFVAYALLVGLAARALIPIGYMPGNLLAGEIMVMCPAGSAATIAMLQHEANHQHAHHNGDSETRSADETCPIGTALVLDVIANVAGSINAALRADGSVSTFVSTRRLPQAVRMYSTRAPPPLPDMRNHT